MTPKISVCIIGLNEEKRLEECLQSVQEIADEIIYVDSYSTDKSVQIARKYTQKIFKRKFDNFINQKNYASDKASNDWVLNIDCDERISPDLLESVKKADLSNREISGYSLNRKTFYIYRWINHSGWYPDSKIRLFNRKYCRWDGNAIHEFIKVSAGKIEKLHGDILHYSFESVSDHLKTIEKFSEMGAAAAFAKGKRSGPFTIVFRTLWVGIRKMIFEVAFLDGVAGLILTGLSMTATWAKYSKLYVLIQQKKDPEFLIRNRIKIAVPHKKIKSKK